MVPGDGWNASKRLAATSDKMIPLRRDNIVSRSFLQLFASCFGPDASWLAEGLPTESLSTLLGRSLQIPYFGLCEQWPVRAGRVTD